MRLIFVFILSFLPSILKAHDSTQINQSVRAFAQMVKNNEKKAIQDRNYHFLFSGIEVDKANFLAKEYINDGQQMFVVDDNYTNSLQKIKDFNTYQNSKGRKKALYVFHGRYFLDYWGRREIEDGIDIEVKIKGSKEKNFYKALKNTQGVTNLSKNVTSARKNELIKRIYNELKKEQVYTEEFIIAFVVEDYYAYYDKLEAGKKIEDVEPKIKVRSSWWCQYLDVKKSTSLNLGGIKIKIRDAGLDIKDKESIGITPFTPERGASSVYSKALFEVVNELANPSHQEQIFDVFANLADYLKYWQEYINSIKNLEKEQRKQKLIDDRNKLERLLAKYRGRTGAIIIRGMGTGNYEIVENGNTDLEIIDLPDVVKRNFSGGIQDWYNALKYYFDETDKELAKYNDNPCRFCPAEKVLPNPSTCDKMEQLYVRGGANTIAEEALKKLCKEIEYWGRASYAGEGFLYYIDCLDSFSDVELTEFFKQVNYFTSEQVKMLEGSGLRDCSKFEEWKSQNCSEFNALKSKATSAGMAINDMNRAVSKLCTIPNANIRQNVNTKLVSYTDAEVRAFLEDILVGNSSEYLGYNVSKINIDVIEAWKKLNNSDYEVYFDYVITITKVSQYNVVVNGNQNVSINDNTGKNWAILQGNQIIAVGGVGVTTAASERNQILNIVPLIPNITYVVDNYVTYTTDNLGRVSRIEAVLRNGPSRRDPTEQTKAKDLKDGYTNNPTDDGGHMIRAQFHGPVEQINYFPQNPAMNRAPSSPNTSNPNPRSGLWYAMEQEWRTQINAGITVSVDIQPQFSGNSKRPYEFIVTYRYNGNTAPTSPQTIPNP